MGSAFKQELPESISLGATMFSGMNIFVTLALLLIIPGVLFWIGKRSKEDLIQIEPHRFSPEQNADLVGAERLDHSAMFSKTIGILIVAYTFYRMIAIDGFLNFFTPNHINLLLLGLCLSAHIHVKAFTRSVEDAIQGASGILIQFPLYFGILALMQQSGLIDKLSDFFIHHADQTTYPLLTFVSAGLVNIFVPSGGGQWAIQGPIIVQSSIELGIPLHKSILAMAYGDEITNMLQPFWALPLLGITRLTAKDILPYTLAIFLAGSMVFVFGLLLF
jgi:short-chain fatty acids transporter